MQLVAQQNQLLARDPAYDVATCREFLHNRDWVAHCLEVLCFRAMLGGVIDNKTADYIQHSKRDEEAPEASRVHT